MHLINIGHKWSNIFFNGRFLFILGTGMSKNFRQLDYSLSCQEV